MTKIYHVIVAEEYRWKSATVGGRPFSKNGATTLNEAQISDEILNSPILEVEVEELAGEPAVTRYAAELAEQEGVDLSQVTGTGPDGAITKADVANYLAQQGGADDGPDSQD